MPPADSDAASSGPTPLRAALGVEEGGLPIRLLHDRVLVSLGAAEGERRSTGGILIPATAHVGRRLAWGAVVGVGQNVRAVEVGDRVLFDPEGTAEIELHGEAYTLLREKELHAVASPRVDGRATGLYL